MTGNFTLGEPEMAVGVEDAATEEIAKDVGERLAFGIVVEVGAEDVLDIGGIGGDDGAAGTKAGDGDGARSRGCKEVGVPI
ncbi:hypothetical protein IEQ34_007095 [Dendrobium chrysotoxum]|uniref:Uncharacterized protein n=1 Tax=Dendrobium chrysotoxum TaxID=161865 RepID=A0AAV7GS66_DENCH|nr:hypothetical protein IEQ34_007095 [Dendrobium chrysotoxum]